MNSRLEEAITETIEEVVEASLRTKLEDVTREALERLKSECGGVLDDAVEEARHAATLKSGSQTAQALAESSRRIRGENSITGIASALVECAARFCGRSALFIHKGDQLLGFRAAGAVDDGFGPKLQKVAFPLSEASSLARAVESLEPVESQASAGELSQQVVDIFGLGDGTRVHLYPIALRQKAFAVLYADPGTGEEKRDVQSPALEVLVALVEAWIEAVGGRKKTTSGS